MKISSFEVSLDTGKIKGKEIEVTTYKAPVLDKPAGRAYKGKERETYGPYLEQMYYDNEILACSRQTKTDQELKEQFLYRYKHLYSLRKRFKQGKETIGTHRTKYNSRKLYSAQKEVFLLSIPYNRFRIPSTNGNGYTNLFFEEAYQLCIHYKIADPRFVPPEYIRKLRDRVNSGDETWKDWSVPNDQWIYRFENQIGREAYNCVHFPIGWTREDTPIGGI